MRTLYSLAKGKQGWTRVPAQPQFGRFDRGLRGPTRCLVGTAASSIARGSRGNPSKAQSSQPAAPLEKKTSTGATVRPLCQNNSVSCGQTSVAMAVNSLTGGSLDDRDINRKHGFSLLTALRSESRPAGYTWTDGGDFQSRDWRLLEKKLNGEKTPVIMGLNGPNFSPSGRGHIVTLLSVNGKTVSYADPADGKIKTTTKSAIESAPGHPQGKFFFYASKRG